ncbi:Uncharacterised protein [Mycobacteroides abscessus subsp. abscessus]|nr:Uncharacterised protein [Mycobacteroides abscessus subsp. abscessus]
MPSASYEYNPVNSASTTRPPPFSAVFVVTSPFCGSVPLALMMASGPVVLTVRAPSMLQPVATMVVAEASANRTSAMCRRGR